MSPIRGEYMDMETMLEGWFMFREWHAIQDFGRMWRDHEGRKQLFREAVDFWGYDDVYPDEGEAPPPAVWPQNPSHPMTQVFYH
jgi:hypothetical protein